MFFIAPVNNELGFGVNLRSHAGPLPLQKPFRYDRTESSTGMVWNIMIQYNARTMY